MLTPWGTKTTNVGEARNRQCWLDTKRQRVDTNWHILIGHETTKADWAQNVQGLLDMKRRRLDTKRQKKLVGHQATKVEHDIRRAHHRCEPLSACLTRCRKLSFYLLGRLSCLFMSAYHALPSEHDTSDLPSTTATQKNSIDAEANRPRPGLHSNYLIEGPEKKKKDKFPGL